MLVEAMLDFPEEEVDATDIGRRDALLNSIQLNLRHTLDTAKQGSLLREGAHVVIAGQPNVGKSSLLNRLSGEEVALVSDIPGTTRDVIRQAIQIRGVPLHIMDTAGLRESHDAIENMGIALTHQTLRRADLILLLLDANQGITEQDQAILASLPADIPRLLVFNKVDLSKSAHSFYHQDGVPSVYVSAKLAMAWKSCASSCWRRSAGATRKAVHSWRVSGICALCCWRKLTWLRHTRYCTALSCSLRNCAWRSMRSVKSPENSLRMTCWERFSAASA